MRKALVVAVVLVAVGLLAEGASAEKGFSISFGIPLGDHGRLRTGFGWQDGDFYSGGSYRPGFGPRYYQLRRYPGRGFGYPYGWGRDRYGWDRVREGRRDREVGREGRQARESVRRLIRDLRQGSRGERERAARELGQLPVDDVVGALIDSLLNDSEKNVRKEAAKSLGKLGAEEAVPALRYVERRDSSKRVREAAKSALEQIHRQRPRTPVRQGLRYPDRYRGDGFGEHRPGWGRPFSELDKQLQRLVSGDKGDRKDAAKRLGKLEDRRAVPALIEALRRDWEEDVREEAAEALGRIGDRSALPALRWAERQDEEKDVRKEARKAIERITD